MSENVMIKGKLSMHVLRRGEFFPGRGVSDDFKNTLGPSLTNFIINYTIQVNLPSAQHQLHFHSQTQQKQNLLFFCSTCAEANWKIRKIYNILREKYSQTLFIRVKNCL